MILGSTAERNIFLILDGHHSHATGNLMWHCYFSYIHILSPPATRLPGSPTVLSLPSPREKAYRNELKYLVLLRGPVPYTNQDYWDHLLPLRLRLLSQLKEDR